VRAQNAADIPLPRAHVYNGCNTSAEDSPATTKRTYRMIARQGGTDAFVVAVPVYITSHYADVPHV